ncbi:hypothetical protein Q1695_001217 [Nippostrongylus brasiliensis]|nr:hypothetical protein Q1695_001217 [Nippostrongylus brasiliensis]
MIHYSAIYRFLGIHLELEFDHLQKFTVQPSRVVRRERLAPHVLGKNYIDGQILMNYSLLLNRSLRFRR